MYSARRRAKAAESALNTVQNANDISVFDSTIQQDKRGKEKKILHVIYNSQKSKLVDDLFIALSIKIYRLNIRVIYVNVLNLF